MGYGNYIDGGIITVLAIKMINRISLEPIGKYCNAAFNCFRKLCPLQIASCRWVGGFVIWGG